uniref:Mixed lineage kinase domain like pseudokinase n=1 Tax=Crocodylus porosus TaxID=8502 RepID=A0A7M4E227_CROPO
MEIAEKVLNIAQVIYTQCEHVKYCQSQCKRLRDRIQTLMRPIKTLEVQNPQQISPPVEKTLKGLLKTLEKAQELVTKYSQKTWLQKFFQASDIKEEFMQVNVCLGDAAQGLSLLLQAEQQQAFLKVFQQDTCNKEDDKDIKADKAFLEDLLAIVEESSMKKDNTVPEIAEIMIENLIKTPWTLLTETRSHVIYKGEYYKCPVAIKVFQNPVITLRDIFKKEIETMKIFESPNILRMYGICIDERGKGPHFSIVMEYCRYGTLRDVLTKNPDSVTLRIGLSHLHALSGFELCKTESSIKRNYKEKKSRQVSSSAYTSPQGLASLSHIYDLHSEIYRYVSASVDLAQPSPFHGVALLRKLVFEGAAVEYGVNPLPLSQKKPHCYEGDKQPKESVDWRNLLDLTGRLITVCRSLCIEEATKMQNINTT